MGSGRHAIDLVGQRFGRLVVLERAGSNKDSALWRCRCDCGTTTIVSRAHLLGAHNTRSCGCLQRERARRHIGSVNAQRVDAS
jgi:hypothetical protein